MSPEIIRKMTAVGPRLEYVDVSSTPLTGTKAFISRLDPQGILNVNSPILESAAEDLGISVSKLVDRLNRLREGASIIW